MSKRFGRNQKRKMRESIAEGEKNLKDKNQEIKHLKYLNQANADAVALTEQILGEYFAGLPAKTFEMGHDQDFVRLHSMSMPQSFHNFNGNESARSLTEKLMILDTVKMEVYRKELREAVVIEGGMPKGPYVAMSIDATKFMPEYAIEQLLARQFIPHLVREIKRHLNDKTS